ncbi:hypothetical protein TIFTF001_023088 [Ficus carica]|uniref:Uncharacterized protein n=1 Tax=Ficus carica TaxID=3494 RepID=A0AA88ADY6_FICCA|nr:hypothetical protein TIFTF001_023088 [Ficus carica]
MRLLNLKPRFAVLNLPPLQCSLRSPIRRFKSFKTSKCSSSSSLECSPWSGLETWRESPINEDRRWGPTGPEPSLLQSHPSLTDHRHPPTAASSASSLSELGALVLSTADPLAKSTLSHVAYSRWRLQNLPIGVAQPPSRPARPPKPDLVSPKEIPAPKNSGLPLNAYMLHNLAHVELNAIDLAWDTVVRFSPFTDILGEGFFADFAHVADDESRHFA